ncbi:histidine kinase [Rhodoblastus sphagnicola]|uniref:histidine kinase n=1 Tax=Rhodoblastus sphagnicola TaxID=333368 RepID=A0A2S6N4C0_9HYPH|nr:chemotaxis protein CheB [Rhodoblastus sphagnicola]MBB4200338.1 two-component system CheB/CheR fusion protein [Rhodoblastus sphagnicola]PPQ29464.1 histidine kinase [Rhodoblastus sphagnicola]
MRKIAPPPAEAASSAPASGPGADAFAVVAIGASAGGLDACRKFLGAVPAHSGMAFILVQHLDPTHASMLVELLAGQTHLKVSEATDGARIEREHLYVIPPGVSLSVSGGALKLSQPEERHGARLPFDFLLQSLAEDYGERAVCVMLSGTGADGSRGLKALKDKGGLVVAQDPEEAGFDGMPRNAIETGAVDQVAPAAKLPEAIIGFFRGARSNATHSDQTEDWLAPIVDLLFLKTEHDFRLYKPGTLHRRIERRMALAECDAKRYLQMLLDDPKEVDLLAKDLLINVTSFFRDPKVFDFLAENVLPSLIREQPAEEPLRIWSVGCSTGEEAYSLAILFREAMEASGKTIKLQVLASDIDGDAVALAREGLYPATIAAEVSPERLARFFVKEERGYRIVPDLRDNVVFTVQDLLADPPFSRLNFVSCRNLLIYLGSEAQAKVMDIFHFALREGGILLLGGAETVGETHGRFTAISKTERIFRHTARGRPGDFGFLVGDGARLPARLELGSFSRRKSLADLCQRLLLESLAPAAVLINRNNECLYSIGPTDLYLSVAPGPPTHDLLVMARKGLGLRLRSAIQRAFEENAPISVSVGRLDHDTRPPCRITVRPVVNDGEDLALVTFTEETQSKRRESRAVGPEEVSQVAELERELEAAQTELQGALRDLEVAGEEQKAINEEALSVNEEFQSANEELLTSKEELQSLNEELTALNNQLQETLDRQRTTSDDLQNVLFSSDVATIFLDDRLNIRFFNPATRALFNVIAGDIGRPLSDLAARGVDEALLNDARVVLAKHLPVEREIETPDGRWFMRRILPYRTQAGGVEGVVITFVDMTERKIVSDALETAKHRAEAADIAKSRFLAAASHDLRQPLQTLALLQGLLDRVVTGEKERKFVARIGETLTAMTGMLNALLDINQIEAGAVHPEMVALPVQGLLTKLRDEFVYSAQERGLDLRMVGCSLSIWSDPRLLEQMLRNLLANALKYTSDGRVLLGCRRRGQSLSIEVWDTGIGIPESEIHAIFEEYHQIGNEARERSRGLGLGLSIVKRLGNLLGHRVRARSRHGNGSMFAIEVTLAPGAPPAKAAHGARGRAGEADEKAPRKGAILIVDDDPEVRELLALFLKQEGHRTARAYDSSEAMQLIDSDNFRPDLVLADFNLPNGSNGVEVIAAIREKLHRKVAAMVLTGDISTETLRAIEKGDCTRLNKPVQLEELAVAVQRALAPVARVAAHEGVDQTAPLPPVVFVVDDDRFLRAAVRAVLEDDGRTVEDFESCEAFLAAVQPGRDACLLIDAALPGMSGLDLLHHMQREGPRIPAVMMTGKADVAMAVEAMKAGASDFIEKPISREELLASVGRAFDQAHDSSKLVAWREAAAAQIEGLTQRQKQIMAMVLAGAASKNIAADLGISQRTVENHRAEIMKRTGAKSLPELARLAVAATE